MIYLPIISVLIVGLRLHNYFECTIYLYFLSSFPILSGFFEKVIKLWVYKDMNRFINKISKLFGQRRI